MKKAVVLMVVLTALVATALGSVAQTDEAWIPGVASFVLPGFGQLLNGQMNRAVLHFGVMVAINVGAYYTTALLPHAFYRVSVIGLLHLGWAIYSGLDAYNVAKEKGFTLGVIENGIALQANF